MISIYDREKQKAARIAQRWPRRGNEWLFSGRRRDCQREFLVSRKRPSYRVPASAGCFPGSRGSGNRPRLVYFKSKAMSPEMAATKNSAPTKKDGRADRTAVEGCSIRI